MPESGDRVDLTLVIESVDELYSGLAPRLCSDGLFIESEDPASAGSLIGFRVILADGVVLIQGRGTVLWTRLPGSIEGPPGMAVQFADVDGDTQETIDAVIDAHLSTGGELFDLDGGGIRDVYPTDALDQSAAAAADSPKWLPDSQLGEFLETVSKARTAGTGSDEIETEVVDLRFEEAIAGFTQDNEPQGRDGTGAMDEAISAAVVAPATATPQGAGEPGVDDSQLSGKDPVVDAIPDILDQWREELQLAGRGPDTGQDPTGPNSDATPWESLLPFSGDDDSLAPRTVAADQQGGKTSTARRSTGSSGRGNRLWFILPAVVIVVTIGAAILLVGGGDEVPPGEPGGVLQQESADALEAPTQDRAAEVGDEAVATPLPTVVTPAAEAKAPARAVRDIDWSSEAGATEVVIRGDGPFDPGQVDAIRLSDPPRVLIRVRQIGKPYAPYRIDVGSPEVVAVRIGHHPELRPAALYVVLDLAAPTVNSTNALEVGGDVARVRVRSAGR